MKQQILKAIKATNDEVAAFLQGSNPQEHIIKIECGFNDSYATVIWRDDNFQKHYDKEPFYPFCWAKREAGQKMFQGDRTRLITVMQTYGISCKGLAIANSNGEVHERMANGYNVLFFATRPMSNNKFYQFFKDAGVPLRPTTNHWSYNKNYYKIVAPNEQFMIATGKRLFKGYESYDDILRMQFDIETTGLDKSFDLIDQIGIRTNKGFEKIITVKGNTREEKIENGRACINEMFDIINEIDPDVVAGYNSEGFDWEFFDVFLKQHFNVNMADESKRPNIPQGVYKKNKQSILKLGGEMEYYYPTVMFSKHITDCLFSVRRAQALDSNMKKATLKYVTKYSNINKPNRVYVPGNIISTLWNDTNENYAFNDENGDWYKVTNEKPIQEGYILVSGEYIVQRYLMDDLWETDKIEERYNESNFLVGKMLPVNFERMCTMGTATIWKYIMMAWSYEHNLAIPLETQARSFTGGLSRLLTVGYIPNVQKLDYNSLYPSIILSFGIKTPIDISNAMPAMLEYVLTQREYFKGLTGKYTKESEGLDIQINDLSVNGCNTDEIEKLTEQRNRANALAKRNDKMQLPLKCIANAFFGSFGAGGGIFPWSDIDCAEETTCCGRQMLRLMLYWFSQKGYQGIVCDSVTGDTPLFIRDKESKLINIKTISELFDDTMSFCFQDSREYDFSSKDYEVLSRNGWVEPQYIYKHKTSKDLYRVEDKVNNLIVDCTKDHSLFNYNREEIKPTEITSTTILECYDNEEDDLYCYNTINIYDSKIKLISEQIRNNKLTELPEIMLNASIDDKKLLMSQINLEEINQEVCSKKLLAGIQYIQDSIIANE